MRMILLALRNLLRNKRRTLITILAVGFGAAAILFLQGFVNGFLKSMVETSVLAKVGAIQIHKKGYIGADEPLKKNFAEDPKLIARLRAIPGVSAVAPRIAFEGMVSNGSESTMFMAVAIDPALEYQVCPKRKTYVAAGSEPLTPNNPAHILIGKTLAESLDGKKGSSLVLQSAGPFGGSTNALDVEVSGFLPSARIIDSKRMATVSLGLAQDLLRMKGFVTEYVVGTSDIEQADEVAARARAELGSSEFEVTTWHDVDIATREQRTNMRWVFGFVATVLFLLVATGITNTMMMSVHERVREIGTMLAVGVRRRQILNLFLWEATFLGLIGSLAGIAVGFVIVGSLGAHGVSFRIPGGDPINIRPHVGIAFAVAVTGFAMVGAALSALYPAWKGSRLRPVEALRSV